MKLLILAIESSCDETSAAVLSGLEVKSNIIASQKVHEKFGGVVPELASRAHQQNIVPVVHQALSEAGITLNQIDVIACTGGPGLNGALLVGMSYAKSLSMAIGKPLVFVDHMRAHILAHFLQKGNTAQEVKLPMLCLTVSGGHTQIVLVNSPMQMQVVGKTIDDAAGEAFDKAGKVLGLPYPGGPHIDRLAKLGNPNAFKFTIPDTKDFDFSFSGLKTSLLYFLRDEQKKQSDFISQHLNDICASYQHTIIRYLQKKMTAAIEEYRPASIAIAGGVSANSALRDSFAQMASEKGISCLIPPFEFTTDNAAMIGAVGYFSYLSNNLSSLSEVPNPKAKI
jgi:N6-L-threonylcarbamoyladenine synthase